MEQQKAAATETHVSNDAFAANVKKIVREGQGDGYFSDEAAE